MKIEAKNIAIRDIVAGFKDMGEDGVVGYHGRLDIRPPFQREFIYKDAQRDAVIDTVIKGFPLNSIYWSVTGTDAETGEATYEVLDGQQRILSIAQFIDHPGGYSITGDDGRPYYFRNLDEDVQEAILNYELLVYVCDGTPEEKLEWFTTINVAGEKLNTQELRNAVFAGTWLTSAKRKFSRSGCIAHQVGKNYVKGTPIRQDFLQTALEWVSHHEGVSVENYMEAHAHDEHAEPLWDHFRAVLEWVTSTFVVYHKQMKGVDWGTLYTLYGDQDYDTADIEDEVRLLLMDDDVSRKSEVFAYVLGRDEKVLGIRDFTEAMIREAYAVQGGACIECQELRPIEAMTAEREVAWVNGGATTASNCLLRCDACV